MKFLKFVINFLNLASKFLFWESKNYLAITFMEIYRFNPIFQDLSAILGIFLFWPLVCLLRIEKRPLYNFHENQKM